MTDTKLRDDAPLDETPAPTEPEATPAEVDPPVTAVFHQLYAFLYNKYVGVVVILAMALATLLGTLLQQVPDSVRLDPASYAAWLEQVRPKYGGWTPILSALGCLWIIKDLRPITLLVFLGWVAVALIWYFAYGIRHSRLGRHQRAGLLAAPTPLTVDATERAPEPPAHPNTDQNKD